MRTENRKMRERRHYVLTVEGKTEKWYFQWLKDQMNASDQRALDVGMTITVEQKPKSYWKTTNCKITPEIFHICDVESKREEDIQKFKSVLKEMKEAKNQKGIKYTLGYSNFTFELWMILHKMECNHHYNDKKEYLEPINRCFQEKFENLEQYKWDTAFHRCLNKITLEDVITAVKRADRINQNNQMNAKRLIRYSSYSYYPDNPSLSINEIVKIMLSECGIMLIENKKKK